MSSVAVAYFYHFLVHVAIVRLIAIKIFNRSAALLVNTWDVCKSHMYLFSVSVEYLVCPRLLSLYIRLTDVLQQRAAHLSVWYINLHIAVLCQEHALKLMAEMKDAKRTYARGDKSSLPVHRFAKTDLKRRIESPRFKVKNLWSTYWFEMNYTN